MTPEIEKRIKAVQAGRVPAGYKRTKVGIVPKDWGEVRFHDMFSRVVRKNKEGNTNVLTISAQYGLINQNEFFNKTVASDDKSNYYLMKKGEFAYNKSYSNGYPFGALKRLDFYDKGIVSPLYICFAASENNQCPDFYVHYFEAGLMNKEIQAFAQEGARNHGLLNISVDDFFNSNLLNPPLSEQKKIAEILATQDRVIELKEKLIAEKQSQKKYLMSVLLGDDFKKPFKLNGVTIDKKKWEKKRIEDVAIMSSGSTPRRDSKDNFCGNILWLSSGELKQKYICDTEEKISDKAAKESNLRVYPEGTFVIAMYGLEAAGIRGTASIIKAKSTISQACMAFTDLNNITNEFLYYWYLYNGQIIGSKYAQGSKQQNLNSDLMGKIQINLPSLPEQKAIADVLSAADEEISLLQKDLEQEKLKKKSLMQLLLTGLVRVA
ncbi:restriction endonuclease subunit S [uncultured Fibrobacter sp.]|uniref:restriction endonuclease subunit S n=1 Tax=uncultured Fibrobacter sp. TaxID=261512 RepID=UPI0026003ABF|nr:restriction endonuclease subunit S [uncultured Fibrobacter sp.]